jgi:hypothetical protein
VELRGFEPPDALHGAADQGPGRGRRTFADRLADRQSQTIPSEDLDYGDIGQAFPPWRRPARNAIFQPPMPEIPPSPETLQPVIDRDADWEAAD